MSNTIDDLAPEVKDAYIGLRQLDDGRIIGLHRLLFHWTLHVDIDWCGYRERYCYHNLDAGLHALLYWDGKGDPEGWVKHVPSGRTRPNADPSKEGYEWKNASKEDLVAMMQAAGATSGGGI